MDLDKKYGLATLRVWGLILNFMMNFLTLFGAANYLRGDTDATVMIVGIIGTIICITVLSKPQN
ncbi:Hypothetical protein I595_1703 [Croceitalea dokdonensis DOKDO 023]|uniref:Uncharacterized protein n=1 Tax=Croceitalea dokdonensis DOKDO 023 TaxID=1300341 RepID=A0A0P7AUA5_9FLAO|nr:hypothetical protein [Croceitalea dokdonensis]KPM32054.1 Hypothetical protein I595_1703 [Croceitalea dokdonensis DOKDO 023]